MKIFLGTFFLSLFFLAFSFGETDTSQNSQKPLDQLRKEYLADKAALDQINQRKRKNSRKKQGPENAQQRAGMEKSTRGMASTDYPKYLNALVKALRTSPNGQKSQGN